MENHLLPLQRELRAHKNEAKAQHSLRFFKALPGGYGEGDAFLGLTVPAVRTIVRPYYKTSTLSHADILLRSAYHEERLAAVLLLVSFVRKRRYPIDILTQYYLQHAIYINNWDLVDQSAPYILGLYIASIDTGKGYTFLDSIISHNELWKTRMAILACFEEIRRGETRYFMYILPRVIYHSHDLIQKAVGWMLREVGKRGNSIILKKVLDEYASTMPRTTLRYALEHFALEEKAYYMQAKTRLQS